MKVAATEPYVIQFKNARIGWFDVITSRNGNRRDCYKLLRAQGFTDKTLAQREWRVVPISQSRPVRLPSEQKDVSVETAFPVSTNH